MGASEYGLIEEMKPHGGWSYDQPLPSEDIHIIRADDYSGLIRLVTLYRIHASIPIGDVEHDVCLAIRTRSSQNDHSKGAVFSPRIDPNQPIGERLRGWLGSMKIARPKIVSKVEASARAKVCEGCTQNIRWRSKCDPCNEKIDSDGKIVRRFIDPGFPEENLKACRQHGVLLSTAVFIDRAFLPQRTKEAPEGCWMPTNE